MQEFPHHYVVEASADYHGNVRVSSPGLPTLETASPAEFGGPGTHWSPETMLVAAVADCFVLSFRAIARVARLEWSQLRCDAVGNLDRIEKVTQFVAFSLRVVLDIPPGTDEEAAVRLLQKAERYCLVSSSLKAAPALEVEVRVTEAETAG